jgi:ABC-type Na+ transport system ATPase subunit NatA
MTRWACTARPLSLRFEDSVIDPFKEFTKITETPSVQLDRDRLGISPPEAKAYRHLTVKERVPRFREFVDRLEADTKRRIEKMDYRL